MGQTIDDTAVYYHPIDKDLFRRQSTRRFGSTKHYCCIVEIAHYIKMPSIRTHCHGCDESQRNTIVLSTRGIIRKPAFSSSISPEYRNVSRVLTAHVEEASIGTELHRPWTVKRTYNDFFSLIKNSTIAVTGSYHVRRAGNVLKNC